MCLRDWTFACLCLCVCVCVTAHICFCVGMSMCVCLNVCVWVCFLFWDNWMLSCLVSWLSGQFWSGCPHSDAGFTDEVWQTDLGRALPHPEVSPTTARLRQGHHKMRLRKLSHMLTNDSETVDPQIYQSYKTLLFSKCLQEFLQREIGGKYVVGRQDSSKNRQAGQKVHRNREIHIQTSNNHFVFMHSEIWNSIVLKSLWL